MDELTALAFAARDGDRAALEALVRATQADVWRFCAYLGGTDEADDLTQEVYVRALRSLPAFRGDAPVRPWLLRIARNTCSDHVRRTVRRRRRDEAAVAETERRQAARSGDPTAAQDLAALVAALPEDYRAAFVLTQFLGLPYADAAGALGCPVGTVRSRVARARDGLLRMLAEADSLPEDAAGS